MYLLSITKLLVIESSSLRSRVSSTLTHPLKSGINNNSIKKIVEQSRKVLKRGGMLMIEHGYDQQDDVGNIFKKNNFSKIESLKDLQSLPRITIGTLER